MTGFNTFTLDVGATCHRGDTNLTVVYVAPDAGTIVLAPGGAALDSLAQLQADIAQSGENGGAAEKNAGAGGGIRSSPVDRSTARRAGRWSQPDFAAGRRVYAGGTSAGDSRGAADLAQRRVARARAAAALDRWRCGERLRRGWIPENSVATMPATKTLAQLRASRGKHKGNTTMKRRDLLKATAATAAAGLARPSLAQGTRILRFVPQADLANPDPVWSTAVVAFIHAGMIWDRIYGLDENLAPHPQMVAGDETSDDGLTWRLTLRDGQFFHDGEPVRAQDCVASILRTSKRVPTVDTLMAATNELTALDDKRIQFRLKKRFPLLPFALNDVFVMPERIAKTDAFTQISEYIGSGPYRFLRDEWKAGSAAAYARNERYVPRQEPISMWAGGKVVNFDRVEWKIIPDPATQAAALQRGEVDWVEQPLIDLTPMLRKAPDVRVEVFDAFGGLMVMAFNHYQPPFDNVKLRRAVLAAVNQQDYVDSVVGEQTSLGRVGVGVFPLASPYASTAGMAALTGPRDLDAARRLVAESGYKGEPIVLMVPTDQPQLQQTDQVTNALFKSLGLNVQYTSMDWGTLIQRRNSKELPDKGGWNCYCTGWVGLSVATPFTHLPLRANGLAASAWWRPTDEKFEQLRNEWLDAPDLATQKKICDEIQLRAFDLVPFIPLGQSFSPTAFRANLSGFAKSPFPVFWGVKRS
jgi:peptide/nickel transport system substrate-binding protein